MKQNYFQIIHSKLILLICRKPKESCTYLTDNFKSKCVQVYNYHRLLTWDQQNGLHMDIFKVIADVELAFIN